MNAFEDHAFRHAVKKTGRKRLIFGGLHTEICLTFAVVQAYFGEVTKLKAGVGISEVEKNAVQALEHA